MSKKSVFPFVLGWASGHKAEKEQAEATMRDTGAYLSHAFATGVMDGAARAREEALGESPPAAIEAPSSDPARTTAKATRRRAAKKA
ncbi:MAG: hypothetical protein HQ581_21875 [Planctomycetes bacterium]|nr:hypothetical protein [Planctomycetota bacterium]